MFLLLRNLPKNRKTNSFSCGICLFVLLCSGCFHDDLNFLVFFLFFFLPDLSRGKFRLKTFSKGATFSPTLARQRLVQVFLTPRISFCCSFGVCLFCFLGGGFFRVSSFLLNTPYFFWQWGKYFYSFVSTFLPCKKVCVCVCARERLDNLTICSGNSCLVLTLLRQVTTTTAAR